MSKENNEESNDHQPRSQSNVKAIPRVKIPPINPCELKVAKILKNQKPSSSLDPEDVLKLSTINITFRHEIPPQHTIERLAGTRVPTKGEKAEIKKYVEIKKGPFDPEEDARIVHNWRKFCKRYKWNKNITHPFLHVKRSGFFYISPVNERRKFVQALAKGLNNRTLYSVYHRFRNIYSSHKQDRYTPDEDRILMNSIHDNLKNGEKPNYAILAKKLNRTRASIWRRYVLLTKKKENDSD
ncbi:hypothetical protein PV327_003368 [Microctonus hyperodae]|uniref:Uncharacterized protein n=1 Tax=Microctonus hyperodae TaxID=165561 RepID=A0AA39G458_MICHY|nr:hypothetical protein PV327_003368 [Microctonus hyperodae]